jgi:cysteate synthase
MGDFKLRCLKCGGAVHDRYALRHGRHDALLRTVYVAKKVQIAPLPGIWKYHGWLPVKGYSAYSDGPVTYKSIGLAGELGLKSLYISFSGYFPEKNCTMKTCTFKELEAPPTLQMAQERGTKKLVIASAGNTGRAFAYAAQWSNVEVFIIVPDSGKDALWLPDEPAANVHITVLSAGYDYSDAIGFSERLCGFGGFVSEGGARNVARRDGMGVVLLDAALKMKKSPRHYFQAVGSGTGAIAAWEAALRLSDDSRFGTGLPKLHLSQNAPFIPMVNAWNGKRRHIIPQRDMPGARQAIRRIGAKVLSNRFPPYGVTGGVYDALVSTGGSMYGVTNREARDAGKLFESLEGIDIVSAASVAVASLIKAANGNKLKPHDTVLLNITGGGEKRLKNEQSVVMLKPEIRIADTGMQLEEFEEL